MLKATVILCLMGKLALASPHRLIERQQQSQLPASFVTQFQQFVAGFNAGALVENPANSTFYATPSNFSNSTGPGKLLKLQQVTGTQFDANYGYPSGLTLFKMMYTSLDLFNATVPATAFILLPYSASNRTVVWTHGTSGITRECGPSNWRTLYYDFLGLFQLAQQGNNVIAPDYAGQGSNTQFNYVAGTSHAHDASYAVVAARQALPAINWSQWAGIGHSEGGMTAWAVAEREARQPVGGYLGGVSLAPSMDPIEINLRAFATNASRQALQDTGSTFYPVFFLETIRRVFPSQLSNSDYLTPLGSQLLNLTLGGGCYVGAAQFFPSFGIKDVWKDYSWLNSSAAKQWQQISGTTGRGKIDKPLLVIQGSADEAVSAPVNFDTFKAHCALYSNSPIQYSSYPLYRHGPVVDASVQEWSTFLDSLFDGRNPPSFSSCANITKPSATGSASFGSNYMLQYVAPSNST